MSGKIQIKDVAFFAVGILFLIISTHFKIHLPGTAVPFTLQTLILILIGYYLSWPWSVSIICSYILIGILGFPAFASAPNSLEMFSSSSVGYLIGFIPAVAIISANKNLVQGKVVINLILFVLAHFIILFSGMVGLILVKGLTFDVALINGVTPFVFGALFKSVLGYAIIWLMGRKF